LPCGARVQITARVGPGPRARHASPPWTSQDLRFGPHVAATPRSTAERTVTPGAAKIRLTRRVDGGDAIRERPPPAKGVERRFSEMVRCSHMSGPLVLALMEFAVRVPISKMRAALRVELSGSSRSAARPLAITLSSPSHAAWRSAARPNRADGHSRDRHHARNGYTFAPSIDGPPCYGEGRP
jgi:hypothetical protein